MFELSKHRATETKAGCDTGASHLLNQPARPELEAARKLKVVHLIFHTCLLNFIWSQCGDDEGVESTEKYETLGAEIYCTSVG